jgi:hypothetical protein
MYFLSEQHIISIQECFPSWYLMPSWRWPWRILTSARSYTVWRNSTDVSEEHAASVFDPEDWGIRSLKSSVTLTRLQGVTSQKTAFFVFLFNSNHTVETASLNGIRMSVIRKYLILYPAVVFWTRVWRTLFLTAITQKIYMLQAQCLHYKTEPSGIDS